LFSFSPCPLLSLTITHCLCNSGAAATFDKLKCFVLRTASANQTQLSVARGWSRVQGPLGTQLAQSAFRPSLPA
jgi:hypothetical protein